MMKASVSVIIPCYQCADTISRCVESVVNQTLPPKEIIIVDDGSKDETLSVILKLQETYGKDWIKVIALKENSGVSVARNTGWDLASQDYIAFLDADDAWHPKKIAIQYDLMSKNPELILSGHRIVVVTKQYEENKHDEISEDKYDFRLVSRQELLYCSPLQTSSIMMKTNVSKRFHPLKRYSEDCYLWLDVLLSIKSKPALIKIPLGYRFRKYFAKGGLSGKLWDMEVDQLDSYHKLWKSGYIKNWEISILYAWSLMKYLRRVTINLYREIGEDKFDN